LHATTISEFIQDQRLDEGKRLLCETDLSVSEIADRVGFRHQCNFSTAMKKRFNLTPSQIRR
jgi:AraC-like DNA-binding protein